MLEPRRATIALACVVVPCATCAACARTTLLESVRDAPDASPDSAMVESGAGTAPNDAGPQDRDNSQPDMSDGMEADAEGEAAEMPDAGRPDAANSWSVRVDRSFGMGGIIQGPADTWTPAGLALRPDGRIVVSGPGSGPSLPLAEVIRWFATDGTPDPSFGAAGIQTLSVAPESLPQSVAVLPDGQSAVFGAALLPSGAGAFVARLAGDGGPDPSFGGLGVVQTTAAGEGSVGLWAADGSGYALGASAIVRFGADGVVDASYGTDAFRVGASAGTIAPDGRLFVATGGRVSCFSSGALDPSFGAGGSVDLATPGLSVFRVGVLSFGSSGNLLVLAGHSQPPNRYLDLARLTPQGAFDASFASGGLVSMAAAGTPIGGAELQDGRIVAWTDAGELIARRADGSADDALTRTGLVDLGILGTAFAGALDRQDRLVLVGISSNTRWPQWFVRRYALF